MPASNKATSFHSIALNISYILLLIISHYYFPYIHEKVYSFFNGLFLILSIILFFYINALTRTSSITHFSYFSLLVRKFISVSIFLFLIIFISFLTNTIEIIQRFELLKFLIFLFSSCLLTMFIAKFLYLSIKPKNKQHLVLLSDDLENASANNVLKYSDSNVKHFHIDDLDSMINYSIENQIQAVYLAMDSKNLNSLDKIIEDLSIYAFKLFWILPTNFFRDYSYSDRPKTVLLNESPVFLDTNQYLLKRSIDVLGSAVMLILLFPLIVVVSIYIKLTDYGPVFYYQKRYGQNGVVFNMIKFRSMKVNSHIPTIQVKDDDERVTSIGKIIRKTSFDEIPQLINILRGEMSLVGPRPQTEYEIKTYSKKLTKFLTRHHVKPGLTGLAQIRSRIKTDTVSLMNQKLESDLEYIKNWSLYLDIKILLNTPISMWQNKNSNT